MLRNVASPFSELRRRAWHQAWKMSACAAANAPPVALHELADKLRIRRIEFLPLLSTAGVGPVENGYVVYINTRAPGATRISKKCLDLTHEDFTSLTSPLRFSVAHEMAHVFFFDLLGGDCESNLLRRHWQALENSCNQMARVLLVPRKSLLREIEGDLFALDRLMHVVRRFRVSPQVFIYRLHLDDMRDAFQGHDAGLIACIQKRPEGPRVIAAHALGGLATIRWPSGESSSEGMPLEKLFLSVDLGALVAKREHVLADAEVSWRPEKVAPCKLELNPVRNDPLMSILSVRLAGYLTPPKNKLDSHLA